MITSVSSSARGIGQDFLLQTISFFPKVHLHPLQFFWISRQFCPSIE